MTDKLPSILLIDDTEAVLDGLSKQLQSLLTKQEVEIRRWSPKAGEGNPREVFDKFVDETTALVATDLDLTSRGVTGLFGQTIVGWCQAQAIPVGDFSRGNPKELPKEPNLFELRVPATDVEGARFIAAAFRGFQTIRSAIAKEASQLGSKRSIAAILALLLNRPHLDTQFSLYMARLGSANSALIQQLAIDPNDLPDANDKAHLLTYILGHVVLNSILKYPGPILSERALCAYTATSESESETLCQLFKDAKYDGPFGEVARYYWREEIDSILETKATDLKSPEFEDFGDFNRAVTESALGRPLAAHSCKREKCEGRKGGFLCPFTHRPVCQRPDCSVSSSSWVPQGAQLSRVERDFYDEWAPLLGL